MNYLVAVSGGVDSVCLLDILSKTKNRLIVAHVEHGIRGEDSCADARFVEALAKKYKLSFVMTRLNLGENASEDLARQKRYEFLFAQAEKFNAEIATAHHADDIIETIALNCERGTGWRGLTVLARSKITRPLLGLTKAQIYNYALKNRLEWVEDATNFSENYQRNRLRKRIAKAKNDAAKAKLLDLRARQLTLRLEIERETKRILRSYSGSRHFLTQIDDLVACELLASEIAQESGVRPTRPRTERALLAVKTARPGSQIDVGDGVKLEISPRTYRIEVL